MTGKLIAVPFPRKRSAPATIALPPRLERDFEVLVAEVATTLGEPPARARRAVEIAVLAKGIAAVRRENGKR